MQCKWAFKLMKDRLLQSKLIWHAHIPCLQAVRVFHGQPLSGLDSSVGREHWKDIFTVFALFTDTEVEHGRRGQMALASDSHAAKCSPPSLQPTAIFYLAWHCVAGFSWLWQRLVFLFLLLPSNNCYLPAFWTLSPQPPSLLQEVKSPAFQAVAEWLFLFILIDYSIGAIFSLKGKNAPQHHNIMVYRWWNRALRNI